MSDQQDYEKLIDYIEQQLFEGKLKVGDKLPAERELSNLLGISRGSVRIGLAVLVAIGVIDSKHGSGNYINGAYDHKLAQIMTMMYSLEDMGEREICGFRYAAEQEAILLAIHYVTDEQKTLLRELANNLTETADPEKQTLYDQMIHKTIVNASGNRLVIARYMALDKILNAVIQNVRETVLEMGEAEFDKLQHSHIDLVEGICTGDLARAQEALNVHFVFLLHAISGDKEEAEENA